MSCTFYVRSLLQGLRNRSCKNRSCRSNDRTWQCWWEFSREMFCCVTKLQLHWNSQKSDCEKLVFSPVKKTEQFHWWNARLHVAVLRWNYKDLRDGNICSRSLLKIIVACKHVLKWKVLHVLRNRKSTISVSYCKTKKYYARLLQPPDAEYLHDSRSQNMLRLLWSWWNCWTS